VIVSALIFVIQLVFNASWSLVFFGRQDPSNALYLVVGLEASIIVMILNFARTDRMAAALQLPYAAWVAFASLLNLAIVLLNPPA
jgi:tryptophan-rich sensory protein